MTTELFRPEATAAQGAQFMGVIRIGRNPRFALVAATSLFLALALVAFGIWGEITRKSRVPGLLVPAAGTVQITAQSAGVLAEVRASEGQQVPNAHPLFVINVDRIGANGETARLVADALRQRSAAMESERRIRELQAEQRRQTLAARARDLQVEIDTAIREGTLALRRVELSQRSLDRFQSLAVSGFVAETQLQQKQEELLDLQSRHDAAKRTANALARELSATRAEMGGIRTQLAADLVQIDRAAAGIAQEQSENEARKSVILSAPQEGLLATVHVSMGATVQAGQVLASFIPKKAGLPPVLEAHLYGPSRSTGFVQPGQQAWLRFAAYPYQKFGMSKGLVTDVSKTPISPQELPAGQSTALLQAAQTSEPLYRIKVMLQSQSVSAYGIDQPLKPGMTLEADLIQDKRAVWEWLLEPVLATGRKLQVFGG